jgi:hypothetical protein
MLVGRDGQLYVMDPANPDSPSTEPSYFMRDYLQKFRKEGIRELKKCGKPCHWTLWGYLLLKISFELY